MLFCLFRTEKSKEPNKHVKIGELLCPRENEYTPIKSVTDTKSNHHTASISYEEISWVDEYLNRQERHSKQKQSGIFWVTEIIAPCLRSVYFDRKISKKTSTDLLRIFNAGRVLESWWINILEQKKDIYVIGENVPCRYIDSSFSIHGRADVLLQREYGELEVHEIKTIKRFGSWLNEPKPEHINQLQFYLNVLGLEKGSIDYINKFAFMQGCEVIDRRFPIKRDEKIFKWIIKRANELYEVVTVDSPPPKEECWKCNGYCSFIDECKLY